MQVALPRRESAHHTPLVAENACLSGDVLAGVHFDWPGVKSFLPWRAGVDCNVANMTRKHVSSSGEPQANSRPVTPKPLPYVIGGERRPRNHNKNIAVKKTSLPFCLMKNKHRAWLLLTLLMSHVSEPPRSSDRQHKCCASRHFWATVTMNGGFPETP
jgi:hypothetical protein